MHETTQEILAELGIANDYTNATLQHLSLADSKYLRDLKLNVKAVLTSEHLSAKETHLIALAIAANNNKEILVNSFAAKAKTNGASDAEIADAQACASLLAANNVLYRFRHFVEKEVYNNAPAKLRMNIMMNPVLGKEFFELISLAVSAVNGCEMCVKSHEQSVLHAGGTENRIWDAIRIASIITSLGKAIY
ncbi:MAG TPA: carboxymuconolactone decarboxylase family protein [Chitinophagales bacterium]|nr:carboxymuconolactone decarboxylase family protein [Chitinophagales bacterium]HMW12719.1 carboxymuconolactone decarboxylase family protein [Chitinophagales bacterium]HMX60296.1 carboxymuconolactone decarboxylase family protein [Chitinophagales bacterium]HMY22942.1 carboxymuconolactone decarboxylase family protein [Chitinophagales bacterium]HMZ34012.1 carboxymuconolactone decarboxylase family protein [Chitinophagales bacterium]